MLIDDLRRLIHHSAKGWHGGVHGSLVLPTEWSGSALLDALAEAPVLEITNVATYFNSNQMSAVDGIDSIIPCCAPLGPAMWFEWKDDAAPMLARVGCLIISFDLREKEIQEAFAAVGGNLGEEGARWGLFCHVFEQWRHDVVHARPVPHLVNVREDGTPFPLLRVAATEGSEEFEQELREPGCNFTFTALLALAFSHCRNVAQVEHHPTRQMQRAAQRKKEALVTYRTLVIDPTHAVVKREQQRVASGEITPRALHICRGHFAEYTADKPLFGNPKNVGRFFVPMHTRGSLRAGAVVKDYEVVHA